MNESSSNRATVVFFAALIVGCGAGRIASDDPNAGGRAKHPQPRASASAMLSDGGKDANSWFADDDFSALDQAIVEDCNLHFSSGFWQSNDRIWSQNVPDRDCSTDTECGDGFCDRGHCAAIWSCDARYGQRCINGIAAPSPGGSEYQLCNGICLDGRCRSCTSDEECVKQHGPNVICHSGKYQPLGRRCAGYHPFPHEDDTMLEAPPRR